MTMQTLRLGGKPYVLVPAKEFQKVLDRLASYDEEERRFTSTHHPFTAPLDEDLAKLDSRERDVIESVNRQPVRNVEELRQALRANSNKPALLLVNRNGNETFLTVSPSNG